MFLSKYSDKSFVVTGNTKDYKDEIKELGGRYNSKLSCGSGWIFSLSKKEEIETWIRRKQPTVIWKSIDKKEDKEELMTLQVPSKTIKEPVYDDIDTLFNSFVTYIKPFYNEKIKIRDILNDFLDHQNSSTHNSNEEVDFYFSNDTTKLYDHFFSFFISIPPIKHSLFQKINKNKFIEHALINLIMM